MSDAAGTAFEVAVIGERIGDHPAQETIGPALEHSAAALGLPAPTVHWVATDDLERKGPAELLGPADAVWCAPGSPYRSLDGALDGIRFAREHGVPFLGTCAGFQHGVIEVARHVAGIAAADHEEYGREGGDLVIHELLCSLVGQRLDVRLVDDVLIADLRHDATPRSATTAASGSTRSTSPGSESAGLRVAGVDEADGQPRVLRLADHPYFVLTLFVPQTSSGTGAPHPLVTGLLSATAQRQRS